MCSRSRKICSRRQGLSVSVTYRSVRGRERSPYNVALSPAWTPRSPVIRSHESGMHAEGQAWQMTCQKWLPLSPVCQPGSQCAFDVRDRPPAHFMYKCTQPTQFVCFGGISSVPRQYSPSPGACQRVFFGHALPTACHIYPLFYRYV